MKEYVIDGKVVNITLDNEFDAIEKINILKLLHQALIQTVLMI